mgnify:CR=1 FL=1
MSEFDTLNEQKLLNMNQLLNSYPLKSISNEPKAGISLNFLRSKINRVKNAFFPAPNYSIKDKELEIAKAWKSASSDIQYYNDVEPVKSPSYYPFLKLN